MWWLLKILLFSFFFVAKIWPNFLMDDRYFSYITEMTNKKKQKKKKTLQLPSFFAADTYRFCTMLYSSGMQGTASWFHPSNYPSIIQWFILTTIVRRRSMDRGIHPSVVEFIQRESLMRRLGRGKSSPSASKQQVRRRRSVRHRNFSVNKIL